MYNNNSNQLYDSNIHTNRSAVDALLKDIGAEPLFSSVNDSSPGIPTPLNGPNNFKPSPVTYNTIQSEQSTFSDVFVSLLQRINQQNQQNQQSTQNNIQSIQNIPNPPNPPNTYNIQNSQPSQIFGPGIQQNQSSNQLGPSNQIGLPNPISILNEMHQRNKRSNIPPKYFFSMDSTTGHFYCQLEVFGKIFKTERPTLRKQQAKEEAALMAIRSIVNENNSSDNNRKFGSDIMKLYEPSFGYSEGRTNNLCKSEIWYKKQMSEFPGKQPRVILLEFCQMHRLATPIYQPYNDYSGNTYYECIVGDKQFRSDKSFVKSSEAKDYIAAITFEVIYKEICETERRNDTGHVDARTSLLSLIENHTASNSNSTISSPLSRISSPLSNTISHSNVTNSFFGNSSVTNPHFNPNSSVTSPHLSIHSGTTNLQLNPNPDVNNSGHFGMGGPQSSVTNSLGMGNLQSSVFNSHLSMGSSHSGVTNSLNMVNPHSNVNSSLTNITGPHTPQHITNITSPFLNVNNSHLSSSNLSGSNLSGSNLSGPNLSGPNLSGPNLSGPNLSGPHMNISSPHSNFNSSHLNEISSSMVLPNFNHEIQNIKVEETSPSLLNSSNIDASIIKTEDDNINSSRDPMSPNPSSPISYHPYRTPGRERFPQNPVYNNNNQFAKKNAGFCKKFTSLLYEMAQSKRWSPPEFNFENGVNGFVCVCSVQDYLFRGKACSRKMDAKESAAEEAYRFLTRLRG